MGIFLALILSMIQPATADDSLQNVCEIPVYIDTTTDIDKIFYVTWSQEIHSAIELWNSIDAGFNLKIASWNFKGDRREGAIVISAFDTSVYAANIIGKTFTMNRGSGMIAYSRVLINPKDEYCTSTSTFNCYSLKNIALHEIGHALGLSHSVGVESIMTSGVNRGDAAFKHIPEADVAAVKAMFPTSGSGCVNHETSLSWSKVLP